MRTVPMFLAIAVALPAGCRTSPVEPADIARPDLAPSPSRRCGGSGGVPAQSDGGGHAHPSSPVPPGYQDLVNPYGYADPSLARLGQPIYAAQCARCHGADGHGCGPEPIPAGPLPDDLHIANRLHDDPYLYWRIHDGGTLPDFMTLMPGFGATLGGDGIWRVITFIRWRFVDLEGPPDAGPG